MENKKVEENREQSVCVRERERETDTKGEREGGGDEMGNGSIEN